MMLRYLDQFDDVLLRTNETVHFTASAWIADVSRTQVLMVYHNIYQSWSWTGGHADGDPDLMAVALREAREETGLQRVEPLQDTPVSLEILPVRAHYRRGLYVVPHLHMNLTYLLTADAPEPIHIHPEENSAVQWFALDDAVAASTEPDMRMIYQKLNCRLRGY